MQANQRAHWGSRLAFILAAAGSAIGLGNIWKFPYIAGHHGGGAFVLIYLACIFVVGVPILIAEMYLGQKSQKNNVDAFKVLAPTQPFWQITGWLGIASAFLILSFYSVVGGWIIDFEFQTLFQGLTSAGEETIKGSLGEVFKSPLRQAGYHFLFLFLTILIVTGGVKDGLEKWNKILMPALLVILGLLLVRVLFLPGFPQAMSFLFSPDTSKLTSAGVLEAVGHSFFTLSLGMGVIMVYGSYLKPGENLFKVSMAVALLDTAIALIAGIVIFSIVFSFGLEPSAGPGLIFGTLPLLFAKMPGGYFIAAAFFFMVIFAALTSAVSILEVLVAFIEENSSLSRKQATYASGFTIYVLGLLTVLSTNHWSNIFNILGKTNFFDLFDKLTSSYFLPIGGILIALFFGWKMGHEGAKEALPGLPKWALLALVWTTRVVAPLAVIVVLYQKIMK